MYSKYSHIRLSQGLHVVYIPPKVLEVPDGKTGCRILLQSCSAVISRSNVVIIIW